MRSLSPLWDTRRSHHTSNNWCKALHGHSGPFADGSLHRTAPLVCKSVGPMPAVGVPCHRHRRRRRTFLLQPSLLMFDTQCSEAVGKNGVRF